VTRRRPSWTHCTAATPRVLRRVVLAVAVLVASPGCGGDPYSRYAAAVHEDVDGAMVDALRMTARMQLTVVHNQIPDDSLAIVALTVRRAARAVRKDAVHFAAVTPPADLAQPHAALSGQLSTLAQALDAMAYTFERCAEAHGAGDSTGRACEAHVAAVSARFAYVGEDLNGARQWVQRLLLPHGVLLPRMTSRRRRVPPAPVYAPSMGLA
jgi:hypothetical protein